ncbi:hypothetical protein [uncultured Veillonella sp.]|uniref:hypothetical protein n=1 Tax=uncultured Veillonella sp. TaxID=159268 RepID=UPI0025E01959|nr:hypothetical protein [uncultured Veillonella sp.]
MMLRRLLLLSCIGFIGTIGVSQAIDVNIPGARPDIGKEAYQEYRIQGEFAKKVDDYQESEVKKWAQYDPNYDNEKLDDDIYKSQELVRAIYHSKTVYIIKDNGADIKFTGPKESIIGWSIDPKHFSSYPIKNGGITLSGVADFGYETRPQPKGSKWENTNVEYADVNKSIIQDVIRKSLEKEKSVPHFVDGGVFTYPGLEKATWDVIGFDDHYVEGTINFTLPKTPTLSYHIIHSLNKDIIKNIIKDDTQRSITDTMGPLANYVLPSIKPASDVLGYTDPVRLGPYTFRVLKNSKFKEHEVIGRADYDIYQSGRIKAVFGKQPLVEGVSVEKKNILYSYLKMIVENHGLKGHKRLQYATVWNNSVPALYFEAVKENSTLFGMVLYDNQNLYTYYLYKPHDVHVSNYKLRDVIQYVDIKSSKELFDKVTVGIGFTPNRIQFMEIRPDNKNNGNDKKLSSSKK